MSEVEDSVEYDSETRDLYQDRSKQGTLSGSSSIRQTRAIAIHNRATKGKNKGVSKGPEYSEDNDATLQIVKKPTRPLSLLIVQVNHPTRPEDNPASLSLSGPQMSELFSIKRRSTTPIVSKISIVHSQSLWITKAVMLIRLYIFIQWTIY